MSPTRENRLELLLMMAEAKVRKLEAELAQLRRKADGQETG